MAQATSRLRSQNSTAAQRTGEAPAEERFIKECPCPFCKAQRGQGHFSGFRCAGSTALHRRRLQLVGMDLPGGKEGVLGQGGAHQLVYQHRKEHHAAHHSPVGQLRGSQSHSQGHTGLGQQGDAQVLLNLLPAAGEGAAHLGPKDFSCGPGGDVHRPNEQHHGVPQDLKIQLRAGKDEEKDEYSTNGKKK